MGRNGRREDGQSGELFSPKPPEKKRNGDAMLVAENSPGARAREFLGEEELMAASEEKPVASLEAAPFRTSTWDLKKGDQETEDWRNRVKEAFEGWDQDADDSEDSNPSEWQHGYFLLLDDALKRRIRAGQITEEIAQTLRQHARTLLQEWKRADAWQLLLRLAGLQYFEGDHRADRIISPPQKEFEKSEPVPEEPEGFWEKATTRVGKFLGTFGRGKSAKRHR